MNSFDILPAIDLKGGRCVRLRQGLASEETVYAADPVEVARRWEAEGARWLHLVDLDGAFQGRPAHLETLRRILSIVRIPVEIGGGLRTDRDVEAILEAGAARAILGTRLLADPEACVRLAARFPGKLAAGIDARDGFVQVRGWTETTGERATDLARRMEAAGIGVLIVTDTSRDGMLEGVNTGSLAEVCDAAPACRVIASGGVAGAADIRALRALGRPNLAGAISGKALYDGVVSLADLLAAARD
jgi:phosphoribosylformimino-5-aminoimidazole carboxamide ribotide isomerase